MYLKTIEFLNWMSIRGKQRVELEPKAYALVARRADNPEASNFVGKSAFVEAIDFALFGRLNKARGPGADGWVSDGEKEGGVTLVFDDGTTVERARKTQLAVTLNGQTAKKDEAQRQLEEWLGLTAKDFANTCYFRQRHMAQLILSKPEERMSTVSAWFRLGPLEAAEDAVTNAASDLAFKAQQLQQRMDNARMVEERELAGAKDVEELQAHVRGLEKDQEKAATRHSRLQEELSVAERQSAHAGAKARYEALVVEGKALRARLEEEDGAKLLRNHEQAQVKRSTVHGEYMAATRKVDSASVVATGKFDGKCPVACLPCPVADKINARTVENAENLVDAENRASLWRNEHNIASATATDANAKLQAHGRLRERLSVLREQAVALQPDAENAPKGQTDATPGDLQEQLVRAHNHVLDLTAKLASIRRALAVVVEARAEQARAADALHQVTKQLATHREAKVVLGKNGAQRRVAEGALSQIEASANHMLRACGIDLGVEVQWSREGSGLEKACGACGAPYPASARVKECERCQTARGPNLVNKLDIVLTDQSGAAEDICGISLQLAAAKWLRADRGSGLELVILDEPLSQLDRNHRKGIALHLAAMLSQTFAFKQAFVISHQPEAVEIFPGRILVTGEGRGRSTVRVTA